MATEKPGAHLDQIRDAAPSAQRFENCLNIARTWARLHLSRTCGLVGCCDNSKDKHATKHFERKEPAKPMGFAGNCSACPAPCLYLTRTGTRCSLTDSR